MKPETKCRNACCRDFSGYGANHCPICGHFISTDPETQKP